MTYNAELGVHINDQGLISDGPTKMDKARTAAKYLICVGIPAAVGYFAGDSIADKLIAQHDAAYIPTDNPLDNFFPDFSHVFENASIKLRCLAQGTGLGALVGFIGTRLHQDHKLRNQAVELYQQ